jgi:hypothetical protein
MTPEQRIDNLSDWLSPMVIKEVRQMVRGREFNYSFGLSVLIGLLVAFYGGMEALAGSVGAGAGIFVALMTCLTLIGVAVVPVGTLNALRVERSERTLDLITVTALSPRKIVMGKLLTQAVKLLTLFAGLAPFMAMSFLLGGIDFLTIVLSLTTLFLWSLWACSAALLLSSLTKSRGLSIVVSGVSGLVFLVVAGLGRSIYYTAMYSGFGVVGSPIGFMTGFHGPGDGWRFAGMVAICLTSMANLILLAENRLSPPTVDSVTPLRIGFLVQFLMIAGMIVASMPSTGGVSATGDPSLATLLGLLGGLQLATVAMFTVSEELTSRRRIRGLKKSQWEWTMVLFRPGGARGAAYVLIQMILLLGVGKYLAPPDSDFNWLIAICGYICFFTGLPALIGQCVSPKFFRPPYTRVAILLFFSVLSLVAEIMHYFVTADAPGISVYHVLSPFRAFANWKIVENNHWDSYVFALGVFGLLSYFGLVHLAKKYSHDGYKH